ncbi:MAG: metallophosphoesterase [Bacteroidota bacterium]
MISNEFRNPKFATIELQFTNKLSEMKSTPLFRVGDRYLSLWQSVVATFIIQQLREGHGYSPVASSPQVQQHPMMQAVTSHVKRWVSEVANGNGTPDASRITLRSNESPILARNVFLSELALAMALAKHKNNNTEASALQAKYRPYSDHDPGFVSCETTYLEYMTKYGDTLKYKSWKSSGDINFGVIDYKLPNDAKVAIIGDWGTGMQDARYLLRTILRIHRPHAIIHLGDIYYSGTKSECSSHFERVIKEEFSKAGIHIPVFTIPGNHDYYAFGYDYYEMVARLNSGIPGAEQKASYFCLRTEDNGWQFLGMDTGYDNSNPIQQIDPLYAGPQLSTSEIEWHKDKLAQFSGKTILLSHNQLFSSNSRINGRWSHMDDYAYLNKYLLDVFQPYFGRHIAAWMWGHEHCQIIFQDGLYGLPKARLVGASAYQEAASDSPYTVVNPKTPIQDQYQLKVSNGYYYHGYALLDFAERASPTSKVKARYYQYPSWGDQPAEIPDSPELMLEEYIS